MGCAAWGGGGVYAMSARSAVAERLCVKRTAMGGRPSMARRALAAPVGGRYRHRPMDTAADVAKLFKQRGTPQYDIAAASTGGPPPPAGKPLGGAQASGGGAPQQRGGQPQPP